MKSLLKRISYKILVISMITVVLSFFSASSVSHAKLTLEEGEYYYSGVQEAEVTWEATFLQKLTSSFKQVANYLFGLITLVFRGVVVGWIEIMEILLTTILGVDLHPFEYISRSLSQMDAYEQDIVNIEKIIFNRVDVLDINIFKTLSEAEEEESQSQDKTEEQANEEKVVNPDEPEMSPEALAEKNKEKETKGEKILNLIREKVAEWYYILRLIVIAFMLIILIFIGIKMAISTVASEKAVYKRMLVDWVVGMAIIFMMHYFMIITININEIVVNSLSELSTSRTIEKEYQYGKIENIKSASEIETTLYESARTRAYSLSFTDGFTGLVIYGVLVYYAWKFALIYFRRLLNIMVLTVMAPVVGGSYAINKAMSGKAVIFTTWFKEYVINVIIQMFHAIIYVTFVSVALNLSLISLVGTVMALILLSFMSKSDKLLRELFKVTGGVGSLFGEMSERTSFKDLRSQVKGLRTAVMGGALGKQAIKTTARVVSKPVRSKVEEKFANHMLNKVSSEKYYKKGQEKDKKREELYNEYINSEEVVDKRTELQNKKEQLIKEQAKLKDERKNLLAKAKKKINEKQTKIEAIRNSNETDDEKKEKIGKINAEIQKNKKELEDKKKELKQKNEDLQKADLEIAEFENMIDNEFLNYYIANVSSWDAIKGNINSIFDPEQYLEKNKDIIYDDDIEEKAREMFEDYDDYKALADGIGIPDSYTEDQKNQIIEEAKAKIKEYNARAEKALLYTKPKKTKREGGSDQAFWRKKKSSVGKTFFDNLKWDKILGLTEEESKLIKEDFKFKKGILTGIASGITGTALLGINPGVGMLLLSNWSSVGLQTLSRKIQFKNSPATSDHTYTFKGFTPHTQKQIARNFERMIRFRESQLAKSNVQGHEKFVNAIFNDEYSTATNTVVTLGTGMFIDRGISSFTSEKLDRVYQKRLRDELSSARKELNGIHSLELKEQYASEYDEYKKKLQESYGKLSDKELALQDAVDSENAMLIGDSIVTFKNKNIPELNIDHNKEYTERLQQINDLIKNNKYKYIKDAIIQLAIAKGVTDINDLYLSEVDRIQIQESIKQIFEAEGEVKKGDLKLEKIINQKSIEKALGGMKDTQTRVYGNNNKIATAMVQKACFEYMKNNGIIDKSQLNTESAKKGIEQMLKLELMTKESKQSYNVISQLNGGQNDSDNFKMPKTFRNLSLLISQVMLQTEIKKTSDVKPIVGQEAKKQAIERKVTREENKTKTALQTSVHTGNIENLVSDENEDPEIQERKLKLLFILQELEKVNREAYKLEGKTSQKKEKTMLEMMYHDRKENGYDTDYEDDYTEDDLLPRERELNILLHGKNDILKIINN